MSEAALSPGRPSAVDAVVIGAGHAGIEAAWALTRLGHAVALVTFDARATARMSCNPSVGGLGKGQIAREIDALGGLMGRLIDRTGIHFRMLNRRKGPAVQAPRAQADRQAYGGEALRLMLGQRGLTVIEAEVTEIVVESGAGGERRVVGVRFAQPGWDRVRAGGAHSDGEGSVLSPPPPGVHRALRTGELQARIVIVTAGTFLRALLFTGMDARPGGRRGEPPSTALSGSLERLGLRLGRLKTGTPPRLARDSIDFGRLEPQPGDEPPPRFSFHDGSSVHNQVVCHLTRTTEATHQVIRGALDRSPLFGGLIEGIGPRYCPSIEDKVVRFPERSSHHIFLEPEGLDSASIYPNGISTSLPQDVQHQYVRTIPGLEEARLLHPGYAVEYDFLLTSQLDATLGVRDIGGLYTAGQINGTSGYEEAAAQGLMAGLNAHARLQGQGPIILARDEAYIGVLVDDLITKVPTEPYRMFTSLSEHRLMLRQDNADLRLAHLGRKWGLLGEQEARRTEERRRGLDQARGRLRAGRIDRRAAAMLSAREAGGGDGVLAPWLGRTAEEVLRRPGVDLATLAHLGLACSLCDDDRATLEAEVKYEGYILKQEREIERARALEGRRIPSRLLEEPPGQLSREARDRLREHRPATIGQASRLQGVTSSDLMILAVHMRSPHASGTSE